MQYQEHNPSQRPKQEQGREQPFYQLTGAEKLSNGNLEQRCCEIAAEITKSLPQYFEVWVGNPEEMATSVGTSLGLVRAPVKRRFHLPWQIRPEREFFIVDARPREQAGGADAEPQAAKTNSDLPLVLASVKVYKTEPLEVVVKGYVTDDGAGNALKDALQRECGISESSIVMREAEIKYKYRRSTALATLAAGIALSSTYMYGIVKNPSETAPEPTRMSSTLPSELQMQKRFDSELSRAERMYNEGVKDFQSVGTKIGQADVADIREQMSSPDSAVALGAVRLFKRTASLGIKTEGSFLVDGARMSPGDYGDMILGADSALQKIGESALSKQVRKEALEAAAEIKVLKGK